MDSTTPISGLLKAGERIALATVVRTWGSTPRAPGARMAVRGGGQHLGTVGGGCGEAEVIRAGLDALADGRPRLVRVDLTDEVTWESEAPCGGALECVVRPWGPELLAVLDKLAAAGEAGSGARLLTGVEPERLRGAMLTETQGTWVWAGLADTEAMALVEGSSGQAPGGRAVLRETAIGESPAVFLDETVLPAPVLLICGGGHIAVPLHKLGKLLEMRVVVVDDRPSFAHRGRFPEADEVICAAFAEALAEWPVNPSTHAVVVTRGHQHDLACLKALLGRGAGYLGMIGSKRRVAGVLRLLKEDGIEDEVLAGLHTPIGLDLGSETPAEIAVAIAAEIIKVRRGGSGRSLTITGRGHVGEGAP